MKIKTRVFIRTLGASLTLILILGTAFLLSVAGIRNTVLADSNELGDSAAEIGAYVLEVQLTEKIERIAGDTALMLDERIRRIENYTRMTADITGSMYSGKQGWFPRHLPLVTHGDVTPPEPCLYIVPGIELSRVRHEVEMAGNINEILRQITVVDRGIVTSTINGESGYVVLMDTKSWPIVDFDPRILDWYSSAKTEENLYWTDVYEDPRGRGPVLSCAIPFYEQLPEGPEFRGVARSAVLLSGFSRIVDSAGMGETGRLFLLNRDGTRIYSSNGVEITIGEGGAVEGENFLEADNPGLRSLGMSMTLGATGLAELVMNDIPVYVAYAPVRTLGWSLGVAVPVREVSASALLIENQIWKITDTAKSAMDRYIILLTGLIALLLLAALCGIAVLAIRFTGAITGPILALNDGVHEVAAGNLERAVCIKTGDELEELSVSFNMMTSRLREHIAETARVTAEQQRIDTELDIAAQIQMSMLPNVFPPFYGGKNEFELYAEVHPAREVGGDFYDFFFIDENHLTILIADVSGKGVPAALFMAITKTIIKNRLQSGEDPKTALETINRQLCDNNDAGMFVTVWVGILEIASGRLSYINAGHNQPLVKRGNSGFTFLVSPPDMVLAGLDDTRYHCRHMRLCHGDTLFLYTDGIVEAVDSGGRLYGKERLRRFLNEHTRLPFPEMFTCFRSGIAAFSGGAEQQDDITMLAIRIAGGGEAPPVRSIIIRADIAELQTLMAFIGAEFDSTGCPRQVRGRIELAAEEIFVNIVRYAYNGLSPGTLTVDCHTVSSPEKVTMMVTFSDYGHPFNPLEAAEPDIILPLEKREPGGLGLLLVKNSIDTIQYSRDNAMNRLEFSKSWQKEEV